MSRVASALNIADLARLARKNLPRGLYEYIDRGAEDEVTLQANRDSIKQVLFRPRVGVDVSTRDISTTLFGVKCAMPLGIAATGLAALIDYDGERSLARASAAAGVPYTIGTSNFTAQAELKTICGDHLWRLIYPPKRRDLLEHHLRVTREAGVHVLVVTLDSPVVGNREYLQRSGFNLQMGAHTYAQMLAAPRWLFGTLLRYALTGGLPQFADMPPGERRFLGGTFSWSATADDFTWDDVRALRRRWDGALVVKGPSTAEDARIAVACGADGLIVSNHGGRSLDGAVGAMQALPEVVDAVAAKVPVLVDGGFMRGADVLKAIALGASAVMVGRATLFGLAAGGEPGVTRALTIFREEIDRALALLGCRTLGELGRQHLLGGAVAAVLDTERRRHAAAERE